MCKIAIRPCTESCFPAANKAKSIPCMVHAIVKKVVRGRQHTAVVITKACDLENLY